MRAQLLMLTRRSYRARRAIAAFFAAQHAITAAEAIRYVPRTPAEREAFEDLQTRGLVRSAGEQTYFMLLPAYDAYEDARRRRLVPLVIGGAVLVALVAMLFYRG
ncbi:hypothetical protein [Sphingosinithalassobacter sp. LHW66-3]|uniref:hypothetical protein n=1 Tax=Sphingosinithalassobacter sp. LHW66-3 TaxID=3424718 RepID=UPI003D6A850C